MIHLTLVSQAGPTSANKEKWKRVWLVRFGLTFNAMDAAAAAAAITMPFPQGEPGAGGGGGHKQLVYAMYGIAE